nr:aldehyde dehydrogenase family protein [Candidatus Delongbacteria bacterium]
PNRLKSVLGLGAKNPAVILPDSNLELTVKECLLGALSFNGQRCTALKILFVHRMIAERFLEQFVRGVDSLKCGMPWEKDVKITPLPEPGKPEQMKELVDDALSKGASILNAFGGSIRHTFYQPAVVYPIAPEMRLYHEEQFGPVIPIVPFDSLEEPIEYIVNSDYGQQAAIFCNDDETLAKLIDPLVNQVCRLNINSQCQRGPDSFPFTGRKDSAEGTLSVSDALRVFSIRTLVAAKDTPANTAMIRRIVRNRKSNFLSTDYIF